MRWNDRFLPQRNLYLLTLGAMWAAKRGVDRLAIGAIDDPQRRFPDVGRVYLDQVESILELSHPSLRILAPFADIRKEAVVRLAEPPGLNLDETWSCTRSSSPPRCGRCAGCEEGDVAGAALDAARARRAFDERRAIK